MDAGVAVVYLTAPGQNHAGVEAVSRRVESRRNIRVFAAVDELDRTDRVAKPLVGDVARAKRAVTVIDQPGLSWW